jgi:SAM-dependent methyltransferase
MASARSETRAVRPSAAPSAFPPARDESLRPEPRESRPAFAPSEVAILETFAIPRYLAHFGEAALGMMLFGERARVAHFDCRTGYPDAEMLSRAPSMSVIGLDGSPAALELARNKARALPSARLEYRSSSGYPTLLPAQSYSHALSLHPTGGAAFRKGLFEDMARVLYAGGQAVVSLPLRGSFPEAVDMVREYALKHDRGDFARRIESRVAAKPTPETLAAEFSAAGFDDVDVDIRQVTLSFSGGRTFTEDPVTRLFIAPEILPDSSPEGAEAPMAYLADAIGKYWSRRRFDLVVTIGTASARKPVG